MNEELLNKLKKLLNLAKSNNQHEADLALEKATSLAVEYGIDLAIVAAREDKKEDKLELVKETIESGSRLAVTQKYASWLLNTHFNVHVVYSGGRYGGRTINLLGDKRDVEFAKFVNDFIQDEMQRRWEYYKAAHNVGTKFKQTFMYNMYMGLSAKLKEAKEKAEVNKFSSLSNSLETSTQMAQPDVEKVKQQYGIVIANKQKAVESFVHVQYPSLRSTRVNINNFSSSSVASDGFRVGQTININRPISC